MITERKMTAVLITATVMESVRRSIGALQPEMGGVLGKSADGVIRYYHFDASATQTGGTYKPDTKALKRVLTAWNKQDIWLAGFVHSHPSYFCEPSEGDRVYAAKILECNPELEMLVLPIVITEPEFEVRFFVARRANGEAAIEEAEARIVDQVIGVEDIAPKPPVSGPASSAVSIPLQDAFWPSDGTFDRVAGAYNLGLLAFCRVIHVGIGGARQYALELARAGVGEHVLIDSDTYASTNIATQDAYRNELGRQKVDCVAERMLDINPCARVVRIGKKLDEICDNEFEKLAFSSLRRYRQVPARVGSGSSGVTLAVDLRLRPRMTLLCGLTDDFYAQARVNRLALHFGLPSLCAQVYEKGSGAEITWTHPDPRLCVACHRCMLRRRYEAYLERGFTNNVTSAGTPIVSTGKLNSLKGAIALMLLHHGSAHPRWAKGLSEIKQHNLIQIQMDSSLGLGVFDRVFSGAEHERLLPFDQVVALPQRPDSAECPDCGSTGDLRDARGTFEDTRIMIVRR